LEGILSATVEVENPEEAPVGEVPSGEAKKRGRGGANQPRQKLVRLWGVEWEEWECDGPAGPSWVRVKTGKHLSEISSGRHFLALPARHVCALALRVPTVEEELGRESALLRLELLGLHPPGQEPTQLDLVLLQRRTEDSVYRASVFPGDYEVPAGWDGGGFLPSPLAVDWPSEAVLLWREGGVLVLGCTGEAGVTAWETWHPSGETTDVVSRLEVFLLELQEEGVLHPPRKICDWAGLLVEDRFLGLPVEHPAEAPPPAAEIQAGAWLPPGILAARERTRRRQNFLRIGMGAAIGVVSLLLLVLGYLTWEQWKTNKLARQVAEVEIAVGPSMLVARDWELLVDTIEPRRFALEKLLLAVEGLPQEGVRISLFEARPEGVRIEGDARNVGLATLYFNSLQNAPGAENYNWAMPSPALQPDNSARFAIDGAFQP
jgi:hypothetical protein